MALEFTTEPSFTGIAQIGSTLVATPGVVGGGTEPYTEISSEWQEKIGDADWTTKTTELSFNFSCWIKNYDYPTIDLNHFSNSYFTIHPHNKIKFYNQNGRYKINFSILKSFLYHNISKSNFYQNRLRKYYIFIKSLLK